MLSAKQQVQQILDQLGDNVSMDDIQYAIYLRQKAQQGLDDFAASRAVSHGDVKARLAQPDFFEFDAGLCDGPSDASTQV